MLGVVNCIQSPAPSACNASQVPPLVFASDIGAVVAPLAIGDKVSASQESPVGGGLSCAFGPTSAAVSSFAMIGAEENSSAPTSFVPLRGWPSMSTVTAECVPTPALIAGLPDWM